MKKQYEKPSMSMDMFEANEYIAACYKIKCNVPSGTGYEDTNKNGKYDPKIDKKIASGRGCSTYHNGVDLPSQPTTNSFWVDRQGNVYNTFYWYQDVHQWGVKDVHFTKIDQPEWETNPNAS